MQHNWLQNFKKQQPRVVYLSSNILIHKVLLFGVYRGADGQGRGVFWKKCVLDINSKI